MSFFSLKLILWISINFQHSNVSFFFLIILNNEANDNQIISNFYSQILIIHHSIYILKSFFQHRFDKFLQQVKLFLIDLLYDVSKY